MSTISQVRKHQRAIEAMKLDLTGFEDVAETELHHIVTAVLTQAKDDLALAVKEYEQLQPDVTSLFGMAGRQAIFDKAQFINDVVNRPQTQRKWGLPPLKDLSVPKKEKVKKQPRGISPPYGHYGKWDMPNKLWEETPTAEDVEEVMSQKRQRDPTNDLWSDTEKCLQWFRTKEFI